MTKTQGGQLAKTIWIDSLNTFGSPLMNKLTCIFPQFFAQTFCPVCLSGG